MQKRKKERESPQGGWGMGSKEPIQNYFLLPVVTILESYIIPLGSYTERTQELTKCKN